MGSIPGWSKSTKEYVTKKGRLAIELRGAQGPARSGGAGRGGEGTEEVGTETGIPTFVPPPLYSSFL